MKRIFVVLFLLALVPSSRAAVVARRGVEPSCVIVYSGLAETNNPAYFAAGELRRVIRAITGVSLARRAAKPDGFSALYVTQAPLASGDEESFRLHVDSAGDVHVTGGCRGVVYGAYDLLERCGGCIWFYDFFLEGERYIELRDCSHQPAAETFEVPASLDVTESPAFARRQTLQGKTSLLENPGNGSLYARYRLNDASVLDANPGTGGAMDGFDTVLKNCHTSFLAVPPETYFATHPEYYSLIDGERNATSGQLCYANEDVYEIVRDFVFARIEANKASSDLRARKVRYYGVSQEDRRCYCACDACKAIEAQYGGAHSAPVLAFVNRIADAVKERYPEDDIIIQTLAYHHTRTPPTGLTAHSNVMPCLCSIECEFSKPFGTSAYAENVKFESDIAGWRALAPRLQVWDYVCNFCYPCAPHPNLYTLAPNLRFFRDSGVDELFEQGPGDAPYGDLFPLRTWLLAKLMWNPDQDVDALVARFCSAYYGAAAPRVLDVIAKVQIQDRDETVDPADCYADFPNDPMSMETLDEAAAMLKEALALVAGDATYSQRVDRLAFGIDYARFYKRLLGEAPVKAVTNAVSAADAERDETLRQFAARMLTTRARHGISRSRDRQVAFWANLNESYTSMSSRTLTYWENATNGTALVTGCGTAIIEDRMLLVPDGVTSPITRVDDSEALDGSSWHLDRVKRGSVLYYDVGHIVPEGALCRLRLRARIYPYEVERPAYHPVLYCFVMTLPFPATNVYGTNVARVAEVKGEYVWYDVGVWKPKPKDRFVIQVLDSEVCDLYVDCLEASVVRTSGAWIDETAVSPGATGTWLPQTPTARSGHLVLTRDDGREASFTPMTARSVPASVTLESVLNFPSALAGDWSSEIPSDVQAAVRLVDTDAGRRLAFLTAAGWKVSSSSGTVAVDTDCQVRTTLDYGSDPARVSYAVKSGDAWQTALVGAARGSARSVSSVAFTGDGGVASLWADTVAAVATVGSCRFASMQEAVAASGGQPITLLAAGTYVPDGLAGGFCVTNPELLSVDASGYQVTQTAGAKGTSYSFVSSSFVAEEGVCHWTGFVDGFWTNAANWAEGRVPADGETAVFGTGLGGRRATDVRLDGTASALRMRIAAVTVRFMLEGSSDLHLGSFECTNGGLADFVRDDPNAQIHAETLPAARSPMLRLDGLPARFDSDGVLRRIRTGVHVSFK